MATPRLFRTLSRWANQRTRWTRDGVGYAVIWVGLILTGLYQQINLIFLVAGLATGPIVASFVVSAAIVRKLRVSRRLPPFLFSGEPLAIDYDLENNRSWTALLAMTVQDHLTPVDRTVPGTTGISPRVFFARVPGRGRGRLRWVGPSPKRGRYRFGSMEVATRSPFGLVERRASSGEPGELIVYPEVGQLSRRWQLVQRAATETRRGRRHDRSSQQQEYQGLRDYRPGDSPRWIHWRTTARLGVPMVKEFEQQSEQDLAILLDAWLPRSKATPEQREAVEESIRFAATLCLETCQRSSRRLLLGWTGSTPGVRQGPASVKLLHEILEQLALLRPGSEGSVATLFDAMPPATLRESTLVVVSTRPINLIEEAERSGRLSGTTSRGLLGRVVALDASKGDLRDLIIRGDGPSADRPISAGRGASDRHDPRAVVLSNGVSEAVG